LGGRISKDITQGYGPEQFMLKKAINGTYKVETNFFGERQVTLSGPTTIMAEIYLYYSDGRQERQVVTLRSGEAGRERDGVLIGEFIFSDGKTALKMNGNNSDLGANLPVCADPDAEWDTWVTAPRDQLVSNDEDYPGSSPDSSRRRIPIYLMAGLGCICCLVFMKPKN
jgi:hypothetical protein